MKFGVEFEPGGKHLLAHRLIGTKTYVYTIPTLRGRYVKFRYLARTRQALKLTAEDGVGDENFI